MKGLEYVLAEYSFIDPSRVAGLGASYGGYMVNWLNGHTDRFACLGRIFLIDEKSNA
jgi:dipeptidyl aminopeptidase/acylaminoacyl peptidase